MRRLVRVIVGVAVCVLGACQQREAQTPLPPSPPFKATASIQEIMKAIVDPAADRMWESVGSTVTVDKIDNRQPHTDAEWNEVRDSVITVMEATNLLVMPGRQVVSAGGKLLDEGTDGVFTAAEAQRNLEAQQAMFAQFAVALREVAERALKAVDAKDAQALFDVGADMDSVCEGCHMTFWYPGQPLYRPTKTGK